MTELSIRTSFGPVNAKLFAEAGGLNSTPSLNSKLAEV
ncbi:hypothetical protein BLJAPNOD_05684 [Ensifer sp. M14]|nr:hypothetical protein BLJAPNOD_05684 [Ensifer sp. M14]